MNTGADDLRKGGRMFVWTLLGVGLAVLIAFTILSMKSERNKYVEEQWARSAAARAAEPRPALPAGRNP